MDTSPQLDLTTIPVRFSHLRSYGRSAAHGLHARMTEAAQTQAMQRGTAVHALVFRNRPVIGWHGAQRRGKDYEAFVAENQDVEILTAAEFEKACRMAKAVKSSPLAAPLLEGDVEQTVHFTWYGRMCRATPDVRGKRRVVDLKTTVCSDPERFQWHSLRFAYHAQLRMQQIATGAAEAYLIAVESTEPFPVTVFRVTDEALKYGEKQLALWMERLITCESSGYFPSYVECIVPLDVPLGDTDEMED